MARTTRVFRSLAFAAVLGPALAVLGAGTAAANHARPAGWCGHSYHRVPPVVSHYYYPPAVRVVPHGYGHFVPRGHYKKRHYSGYHGYPGYGVVAPPRYYLPAVPWFPTFSFTFK